MRISLCIDHLYFFCGGVTKYFCLHCFIAIDRHAHAGKSGKTCKSQLVFWLILVSFLVVAAFLKKTIRFVRHLRPGFLKRFALQPGKIAEYYKSLCAMEQEESAKNPENKAPYKRIFDEIRVACIAFQNEANSVKIHLPKAAAKSRGKRALKVEPEDD